MIFMYTKRLSLDHANLPILYIANVSKSSSLEGNSHLCIRTLDHHPSLIHSVVLVQTNDIPIRDLSNYFTNEPYH